MTDDHHDNSRTASNTERRRIEIPDTVELPRLLDFYELQQPEHTRIHEFYDNLRDGSLTTTACEHCEETYFPPRVVCPSCQSEDLTYVSLPHQGTLYSFTEVRAGAPIGMEDDLPFVTGIVELDDVRLSARIDDASLSDLDIGDPVRLTIVEIDGPEDYERVYYRFKPE